MSDQGDLDFMRRALALGEGQIGRVAPNPAVGCVIVREGAVIGEGATADGGRPHAEEIALSLAGERAIGAAAYVTLEPCAARSNGAKSCSQLLLDAHVARVVIATLNPHHQTGGAGLGLLRAAGVAIEIGLCEAEARAVNAGFFCLLETGRPLVVLGGPPSRCDAVFAAHPGETPEAALLRLGEAGMTRVWANGDHPLLLELAHRGRARIAKG